MNKTILSALFALSLSASAQSLKPHKTKPYNAMQETIDRAHAEAIKCTRIVQDLSKGLIVSITSDEGNTISYVEIDKPLIAQAQAELDNANEVYNDLVSERDDEDDAASEDEIDNPGWGKRE